MALTDHRHALANHGKLVQCQRLVCRAPVEQRLQSILAWRASEKPSQRTLNASWDNQEIWNRGIFSVPICENLLHPLWIWAQVAQGFQCAWNAVYGQTLCQHCVDGRKKQQKGEILNKYRTAPPHDLRRNTAAMWPLPLLGGYSIDPCVA